MNAVLTGKYVALNLYIGKYKKSVSYAFSFRKLEKEEQCKPPSNRKKNRVEVNDIENRKLTK